MLGIYVQTKSETIAINQGLTEYSVSAQYGIKLLLNCNA